MLPNLIDGKHLKKNPEAHTWANSEQEQEEPEVCGLRSKLDPAARFLVAGELGLFFTFLNDGK